MGNSKKDSTDLDDFFNINTTKNNDNFFDNLDQTGSETDNSLLVPDIDFKSTEQSAATAKPVKKKTSSQTAKRSSKDFSPDMDAIVITAQSPMIIEAMKYYSKNIFSAKTHGLYQEALNGVNVYIKILNRNPHNYKKLQSVIVTDEDCQRVEQIAFDLFEKADGHKPTFDSEKLKSFELFYNMLKTAVEIASIYITNSKLKKFYHLGGEINLNYLKDEFNHNNTKFVEFVSELNSKIKAAQVFLRQNNINRIKKLERTNFNIFITNASLVIHHYFDLINDKQNANFYFRLHENYLKYYM